LFDAGNNTFINPQTAIKGPAPSLELNLMQSTDREDSAKTTYLFFVGINYNYAEQDYKTPGTTKSNVFYTATINEFLFNLGGSVRRRYKRNFFNLNLYVQYGPTYAHTEEVYYTYTANLTFPPTAKNSPEFLQFYLSGSIHYGYQISKRMVLLAGLKARFYLAENSTDVLGMAGNNILYNYAPIKIATTVGFVFNFGK
jgi:hypothetical protein